MPLAEPLPPPLDDAMAVLEEPPAEEVSLPPPLPGPLRKAKLVFCRLQTAVTQRLRRLHRCATPCSIAVRDYAGYRARHEHGSFAMAEASNLWHMRAAVASIYIIYLFIAKTKLNQKNNRGWPVVRRRFCCTYQRCSKACAVRLQPQPSRTLNLS